MQSHNASVHFTRTSTKKQQTRCDDQSCGFSKKFLCTKGMKLHNPSLATTNWPSKQYSQQEILLLSTVYKVIAQRIRDQVKSKSIKCVRSLVVHTAFTKIIWLEFCVIVVLTLVKCGRGV